MEVESDGDEFEQQWYDHTSFRDYLDLCGDPCSPKSFSRLRHIRRPSVIRHDHLRGYRLAGPLRQRLSALRQRLPVHAHRLADNRGRRVRPRLRAERQRQGLRFRRSQPRRHEFQWGPGECQPPWLQRDGGVTG